MLRLRTRYNKGDSLIYNKGDSVIKTGALHQSVYQTPRKERWSYGSMMSYTFTRSVDGGGGVLAQVE